MPAEVKLPMSMHSGTPANPIVKVGDTVKVGQVIGEADGIVSSPVHASVSGTIKSIDTIDTFTGERAVTVTITADGAQTPLEGIGTAKKVTTLLELLEVIKDSGAVEPGGMGYPTAYELALKNSNTLDYLLVNGLESEPNIASGAMAMTNDTEYVWEGVKLLKMYLGPRKLIICIENNKPEAVKKMKKLSAGVRDIELRALSPLYPQGKNNVLVYNVTGRIVPEGGRLADIGCIVINCATVAAIAKYVKTGSPLVSKCVTVGGLGVVNPKNVIVPIGTPVSALLDYCGGLKDDAKKIILGGGPMTGAAIPGVDIPITKLTNAVLAFPEKNANPPEAKSCIKCGRCVRVCPMRLLPPYIENAFELKKLKLLQNLKVDMCAGCGCCAYTCPAKRPLVQVMILSKDMLNKMSDTKEAE